MVPRLGLTRETKKGGRGKKWIVSFHCGGFLWPGWRLLAQWEFGARANPQLYCVGTNPREVTLHLIFYFLPSGWNSSGLSPTPEIDQVTSTSHNLSQSTDAERRDRTKQNPSRRRNSKQL